MEYILVRNINSRKEYNALEICRDVEILYIIPFEDTVITYSFDEFWAEFEKV